MAQADITVDEYGRHLGFFWRWFMSTTWGEGATTLEWRLPSPPPFHSYEEVPVVT